MTVFRSIVFQIYFAVISVVMNIGWSPAFLGPQRWAMRGIEIWSGLTMWGLRVICGLTYEVRGREHLAAGPVVYAGKHQTMWDILVIPLVIKDPALVLKRELLFIPFFGWYALKTKMIALDRGAHAKALRSLIGQGKDRIASGRSIAIFPEGTRKKLGAPTAYKPGVAALYTQLGVACVPFALNSGLFWNGPLRRPGKIVIEFLPAIPPGLKRPAFMAELETRVETATAKLVAEGQGA